jgi:hypothetical protein
MDIGLILTPLILIAVVVYVAWPLLIEKREFLPQEGSELEIAQEEKDNVLANLKDIEMDFRTGKLSQEDYEALSEDFKERAISAIKRVELLEHGKRALGSDH